MAQKPPKSLQPIYTLNKGAIGYRLSQALVPSAVSKTNVR